MPLKQPLILLATVDEECAMAGARQLGMETVVMGRDSIDRAHQPDEYLELAQIQPCIALLQHCIRHYCL